MQGVESPMRTTKEFWRNFWTTIKAGKVWRGDICNRAKDGTIYWVDTTIVPFLGKDGKPEKYVAIRAVITERKQAEEELRITNGHLTKLTAMKDEFIAHVSHELRTPLAGIKEGVSLIADGTLGSVNPRQTEFLTLIDTSVDRLANLIVGICWMYPRLKLGTSFFIGEQFPFPN